MPCHLGLISASQAVRLCFSLYVERLSGAGGVAEDLCEGGEGGRSSFQRPLLRLTDSRLFLP